MIWAPSQELMPISRLLEQESHHALVIIAHGGIAIWCPLQIEVDEFLEVVCTHDLVRVDRNDLVKVQREENVEEENLACSDDLCFSRCWRSHIGHLYVRSSYWKL